MTKLKTRNTFPEVWTRWLPEDRELTSRKPLMAPDPLPALPPAEAERATQWDLVDVTSADSFPASDPPCWTLGRDTDTE